MEVHFTPDTEARLQQLASISGRPADDLLEDALAGYLEEVTALRQMLDRRHDDLESDRVQSVNGEEFFETLRQREEELLKRRRAE
jgi:predicted transcriptional regulator